MTKKFGRVFPALAVMGMFPFAAFADEIVHFANGAEMTVRSHSIEKDKNMVRLDLGGNSFIAFPMSMVDKIVNAGQNVFLNPGFHPANQAIAGIPGGAVAENSIRGAGDAVGLVRQPGAKGTAGVMLGEVADALPAGSIGGPQIDNTVANSRRKFNPGFPSAPGGLPQVIMPPGQARAPIQFAFVPSPPAEKTPPPPPVSDPVAEDSPETP